MPVEVRVDEPMTLTRTKRPIYCVIVRGLQPIRKRDRVRQDLETALERFCSKYFYTPEQRPKLWTSKQKPDLKSFERKLLTPEQKARSYAVHERDDGTLQHDLPSSMGILEANKIAEAFGRVLAQKHGIAVTVIKKE